MDPNSTENTPKTNVANVVTPASKEERSLLDQALESIGSYKYGLDLSDDDDDDDGIAGDKTTNTKPGEDKAKPDDDEAIAFMMMSPHMMQPMEKPTLQTEGWPYVGQKPSPISIGTARKFLATAYAAVNCKYDAAGVHGYAWIIETEETWLNRDDITEVIVPPKKPKEVKEFDYKAQWAYAAELNDYERYNHLIQAGKAKIIEWFGKEMFTDLHVQGMLPVTKTPKDLLEHLSATYAQVDDQRWHMDDVEEAFNKGFDPKRERIEAYFMRLQDAREQAELLEEPFTDRQAMRKVIKQMVRHYGEKETGKAEKKWSDKPANEKNWEAFKTFWKNEVHRWDAIKGKSKESKLAMSEMSALNATVQEMQMKMVALQAEARSTQERNEVLSQQIQFHQALQASRSGTNDDVSTITDYMQGFEQRMNDRIANISSSSSSHGTSDRRSQGQPYTAQGREPKDFKSRNDGKGKRFTSYCWKCGCNCTHWTRRCTLLSEAERKQYRDASFSNLMGGSTKFLDRRDKYQADYQFDSL